MSEQFHLGTMSAAARRVDPGDRRGVGTIRTKTGTSEERRAWAARQYPEARREDFAIRGRVWTDTATGQQYKAAGFDPAVQADPKALGIVAYVVVGDNVVFLRPRGQQVVTTQRVGSLSPIRELVRGTEQPQAEQVLL